MRLPFPLQRQVFELFGRAFFRRRCLEGVYAYITNLYNADNSKGKPSTRGSPSPSNDMFSLSSSPVDPLFDPLFGLSPTPPLSPVASPSDPYSSPKSPAESGPPSPITRKASIPKLQITKVPETDCGIMTAQLKNYLKLRGIPARRRPRVEDGKADRVCNEIWGRIRLFPDSASQMGFSPLVRPGSKEEEAEFVKDVVDAAMDVDIDEADVRTTIEYCLVLSPIYEFGGKRPRRRKPRRAAQSIIRFRWLLFW